MAVYKFRVTFEDYDDVSRDIEIKATQTFEDLHYAIHSYIGFDASKQASFFMSDDYWKKGKEISNRDLKGADKENIATMRNARLCDYIIDPHQKIYYIFDTQDKWTFRIELIKILTSEDSGSSYPKCVRTVGEAPKQYPPAPGAVLPQPEDFDESTAPALDVEEEEPEVESGVDDDDIPAGVEEIKGEEEEIEGELGEIVDDEPKDEDEV
jgi:hypothetical protein